MSDDTGGPGGGPLEETGPAAPPETRKLFRSSDPRYWLRLLGVGLLGGLLIAFLGYTLLYIHIITQPAPSEICCITPAELGHDYRSVSFAGADNVRLAGWYIPSRNGAAVLLLHGYGSNRVEMIWRADMLAKHDYGVLLYDLRAHGESEGELRSWGWQDLDDLPGALAFLREQSELEPDRIGLLGFSIGGQVALRAAATLPEIKAVVADGPSMVNSQDYPPPVTAAERWFFFPGGRFLDWGLALRLGQSQPEPVVQLIPRIAPRPLLLIAGTADPEEQRLTQHYYEQASPPVTLWKIPEAGHGGGPAVRPQEYQERIVSFFDAALLGGE